MRLLRELGAAENLLALLVKTLLGRCAGGQELLKVGGHRMRRRRRLGVHWGSNHRPVSSRRQFYCSKSSRMSVQDERVLHFKTPEDMVKVLESKGRPLNTFKKGDTIEVWNKMKKG